MYPAFKVRFSTALRPAKAAIVRLSPVIFWKVAPVEKIFLIPTFKPASSPISSTFLKELSLPLTPPAIFKFTFFSSPNAQLLMAPNPLCKIRPYFGYTQQ